MIQFVENHYCELFERSSLPDCVIKEKLWSTLTTQLNCKGPNKNESGWRRCFIAYKAATRIKLKGIQAGSSFVDKLNTADLRIAKMCKMDTYGVDYNLMLSQVEGDVASNATDNLSLQCDQTKNVGKTTTVATFSLPLINANDYMEAMNSSSLIFEPSESTSVETSDITQQIDLSSTKTAQNENTINFSSVTHQRLNIGDIVTGIFGGSVTEIEFPDQIVDDVPVVAENQNRKPDRSHATEAQKDKLVQLIEENYSALFGRISNKINADLLKAKLWQQIMCSLNSMGPKKTVEAWKRCLSSLKDLTKKKLTVARNSSRSKVHGKLNSNISLREQKLIKMFGIDILDGCSQLEEIGCNSKSKLKSNEIPPTKRKEPADCKKLCTNSTVSSAMVSAANGERTLTKSPEPLPQPHDIHSSSMVEPRYHWNNSIVSYREFSDVVKVARRPVVPITSLSNSTLSIREADDISKNEPSTSCQQPAESTVPRIPTVRRTERVAYSPIQATDESSDLSQSENDEHIRSNRSGPHLQKKNIRAVGKQQSQENDSSTIRPLQESRPQRRGVEVHPKRFVRPRLSRISNTDSDDSVDDNDERSNRRRFRLSKPLGMLAEESLELQKENNALLREMLNEFRQPK